MNKQHVDMALVLLDGPAGRVDPAHQAHLGPIGDWAKAVWNDLLFYGEREIASHKQIGEGMSAYAALYKRHPVCLLQSYQQIISYGDLDALAPFRDMLWLHIIRTFFLNTKTLTYVSTQAVSVSRMISAFSYNPSIISFSFT